jgi:hypothetical protein
VILHLPDTAHEVPHERSVVRFILVTATPLQVVPQGRVDVTVHRDTLLPVIRTILTSAVLEMLGGFEDHGFGLALVGENSEAGERTIEIHGMTVFCEPGDFMHDVVATSKDFEEVRNYGKGHEITSPLPFLDIPNGTAGKFTAAAGVFNRHSNCPPFVTAERREYLA